MAQGLTPEQLSAIVAEVQRLQQRRETELDTPQVKQILEELNLPPELLDEALIQLQRRQALEVQQKRNRWIASGIAAALVVAIAGSVIFIKQQHSVLGHVSAQQNRITLAQDDGGSLNVVSRQINPDVFYRVTLKDAPLGKKLDLSCDWIDPNGQIVKQNRYQTQEINRSIWDTHCHYAIGDAAPSGTWKVQMVLDGRPLSSTSFEVR